MPVVLLVKFVGVSMCAKKTSIPVRNIASFGEIVLCVILLFCLLLALFFLSGGIKKIPPLPEQFVMERACIFRGVSHEKGSSYLYLRVGVGDESYKYVVEAHSGDVRHLDLSKSRKLWVAVNSDRSKKFVWSIYDAGGGLLISRSDILYWAKYQNVGVYLVMFGWSIASLWLLVFVIRDGVWNRCVTKRKEYEGREN